MRTNLQTIKQINKTVAQRCKKAWSYF